MTSLILAAVATVSCKEEGGGDDTPTAECGNGKLDPGEACEGDPVPMGCDPMSCQAMEGFMCLPVPPTMDDEETGGVAEAPDWQSTCSIAEACGNGLLEGEEACDDGDLAPGDGCNDLCMVEAEWACYGEPSSCEKCGDGFVDPNEECDGGIDLGMASPGCTETCLVIPGWECNGEPSLCGPDCGDGMWFDTSVEDVTPGFAEGCDDGNNNDGDGCDSDCNVEDGCVCDGNPPGGSNCVCGGDSSSGSDTMGDDTMGDTMGDTGATDSGTDGSTGAGSGSSSTG